MLPFPTQIQIISDLHLETPLPSPSYLTFKLPVHGPNLCLLGDIGLVIHNQLFDFLRRLLDEERGTRIFYILGNHEAYETTHDDAIQKLRDFEQEAKKEFGGRFVFLHRDRYDLDKEVTILGCTLWSKISADQVDEAQTRLTDYNEQRGIRNWSIENHLSEHALDLDFLNTQVQKLGAEEPQRQIVILTHHSPTIDARASDPRFCKSPISSCFATDLSNEMSWKSPMVRMWAFGHTHVNCKFQIEETGLLVVTNQKGYTKLGDTTKGRGRMKTCSVEVSRDRVWKVVDVEEKEKAKRERE
ncbi:hypothetical protein P280DRAFT_474175 [Massarina eburnea CBS 473.64]|uniref:Calcineurin-like phosphoesterase domain-containing protein n=1 Tax=Massarina eburnea CBS 473.64 TaxID=1395130 RepID=A0A6A6RLY5_9PLEO|nr:hypothetical protein P280DRAFT_474175 [Massarina eburnea CBS 473.64]